MKKTLVTMSYLLVLCQVWMRTGLSFVHVFSNDPTSGCLKESHFRIVFKTTSWLSWIQ